MRGLIDVSHRLAAFFHANKIPYTTNMVAVLRVVIPTTSFSSCSISSSIRDVMDAALLIGHMPLLELWPAYVPEMSGGQSDFSK
jgi:hypothetical protein